MSQPPTQQDTITVSTTKLVFGHVRSNGKRVNRLRNNAHSPQGSLFSESSSPKRRSRNVSLPTEDNTPEGLQSLLAANRQFREIAWPAPFDKTRHQLHLGDARDLSWIPAGSVHLVVTSPPYWTLKEYARGNKDQMRHFEEYEYFLAELDRVWQECHRVLAGGGRICCVVGDVCVARKKQGRHFIVP